MRKLSGFTLVLLATAIAGLSGYLITWLVPRVIGFAAYADFAVFWSLLFLVVSALSGIQQEVTRSTSAPRRAAVSSRHQAPIFAGVVALIVFLVVLLSSPLWRTAFAAADSALVWPLALGAAVSVLVAVLTGTAYGTKQWPIVFLVVVVEALVRVVGIALGLVWTNSVVDLAWLVVLPFAVALLITLPIALWTRTASLHFDVGYRDLSWNVARTVAAAASMGLLVSGFPFILAATSRTVSASELGLLVLVATLVRAPLIVTAMALQSYLIVFFRDHRAPLLRSVVRLEALVISLAIALGALGWLIGPVVFTLLFPNQAVPSGGLVGVLVLSSGLVAALCVSAPAVLALGRHGVFTAGWLVAAFSTVACLLLPMAFLDRAVLALVLGPVAGLVVHSAYLVIARTTYPEPASAG
ncbi:hypothetical protein E6C70_00525 [Glaciibacter flavus]|uniref:Polysaccharide biosynthesis protein n=1 Tax=Orlajensenia flava TaxID=2565934 RepID=A0A4S4G0Z7_9MICO|nr:hypothetical protein [Glaciibacter flavus]THG36065.1 hypothetical protein E6C70_00525 [Glaciibacter flavus]